MLNIKQNVFSYLKNFNSLEWIIGLNVAFFLIPKILKSFGWFTYQSVALAYDEHHFLEQIGRLFSYGFFHYGFVALFFNMLLLFYFGSILLDYISDKKFLIIYFLGIIFGGLFFWWSHILFKNLFITKSPLLGASAGVMAVMTYVSLLLPHYQIKIRFLGFYKLIHILIFFIIFNLLQIPLGNPGGYFAHLGGLTIGFAIFIFDKFIQEKILPHQNSDKSPPTSEEIIDRLLEKISRSGYNSLTKEEKDELFRQSKK